MTEEQLKRRKRNCKFTIYRGNFVGETFSSCLPFKESQRILFIFRPENLLPKSTTATWTWVAMGSVIWWLFYIEKGDYGNWMIANWVDWLTDDGWWSDIHTLLAAAAASQPPPVSSFHVRQRGEERRIKNDHGGFPHWFHSSSEWICNMKVLESWKPFEFPFQISSIWEILNRLFDSLVEPSINHQECCGIEVDDKMGKICQKYAVNGV